MRTWLVLAVSALGCHHNAAPPAAINVYGNPNTFDAVPALAIGDPAPALTAAEWIGRTPTTFAPGRVYVVEFFASWCQPCQKSIPDLKRIAKQHAQQVTVVGVAAAEREGRDPVRSFVGRSGVTYPVAYVEDEAVFRRWMWGARVSGLPWVFVVDRAGRIAWWGQPFDEDFETTLAAVVGDTYDPARGRAEFEARQARARPGWDLAPKMWAAYQAKRYDQALAMLDRLAAIDPGRFWYEVAFKFKVLLVDTKDAAAAYAYGRTLVDGPSRNNPHALVDIGTAILDIPDGEKPDLDLAGRALVRANELTLGENPDVMRGLAELSLRRGQYDVAIAMLEKALPLAAPQDRAEVKSELARARKH
jgi:thiol-disulfide isomerase/thioredoxin